MVFGEFCRGRHFSEAIQINGTCATALHLLKVVFAFYVPHKQQTFQRLNIRTRRHHIDGDGNAWVIVVSEL